jgi:hypothetical protein
MMTQRNGDSRDTPRAEKHDYEPPMIEQTASFERLTLACGRQPGDEGQGGLCDPLDEEAMGSANS